MKAVKFTKNELKKQKDGLKRFNQYLPTLQLKKQQLQVELFKLVQAEEEILKQDKTLEKELDDWVAVFEDDYKPHLDLTITSLKIDKGNIAGIDIPVLEKINFETNELTQNTPLWAESGIEALKKSLTIMLKKRILHEQISLIRDELQTTSQRVNLFEKVKIPEARDNIRRIRIALGDIQTAAVVTGKIAKNKIEQAVKIKL